jgi:hypothetical protein
MRSIEDANPTVGQKSLEPGESPDIRFQEKHAPQVAAQIAPTSRVPRPANFIAKDVRTLAVSAERRFSGPP